MWADGKIVSEELVVLGTLQQQLGIPADEVAAIEREVMGMTKEEALVAGMGTNVPKPPPAQPMPVSPPDSFDTFSGGGTMAGSPPPAGGPGAALAPGSTLRGRYEVLSVLGRGGMGQVLKVRDLSLGEVRALKLLAPEHLGRADLLDRMKREVRLCQMLRHPGIVQVFDYDEDEASGTVFFTMEFMEGQTLRKWLSGRSGQPVPLEDAERIGRGLLAALEYAHGQKVVHLDLKPDNVMVSADLSDIRILDFGISRAVDVQGLQTVLSGAGTPYYMAPEQERGGANVGAPADVYALGAMLYELLVGAPPRGSFRAPVDLRPDVPLRWSEGVMRALSPDPAVRPGVRDVLWGEDSAAGEPAEVNPARAGCVPGEDLYFGTPKDERLGLLKRQRAEDQEAWLAGAEAGDPYAQFLIGRAFYDGIGPYEESPSRAAEWYRKAADQGHNPSRANLGQLVFDDQPEEAVRLFRAAAHEGDANAQFGLGLAHYNGQGVKEDNREAVKWFQAAFDQGHEFAGMYLGSCYDGGIGVSEDRARAHDLLMPFAIEGNADAQYLIGDHFYYGAGVEKDQVAAVSWYRRAAEQDHPDALANLGAAYQTGDGAYEDDAKGLEFLRRAAELGSSSGMLFLGLMVRSTDPAEAKRLFQAAVDAGDARAMVPLAEMTLAGQSGEADPETALALFRSAADLGEPDAVEWLNSHPGLARRAWSEEQGATRASEDFIEPVHGSLKLLACLFYGAVIAERGKVPFSMKGKVLDLLTEWADDDRRAAKAAAANAASEAHGDDSWPRNTDTRGFYSALAVLHEELNDGNHEALYRDLYVSLAGAMDASSEVFYDYCHEVVAGLGMGGDGVLDLLL